MDAKQEQPRVLACILRPPQASISDEAQTIRVCIYGYSAMVAGDWCPSCSAEDRRNNGVTGEARFLLSRNVEVDRLAGSFLEEEYRRDLVQEFLEQLLEPDRSHATAAKVRRFLDALADVEDDPDSVRAFVRPVMIDHLEMDGEDIGRCQGPDLDSQAFLLAIQRRLVELL